MTYQIQPWRWRLKKLARRGAVLCARTSARLSWRRRGPRLTVLTYHRFDGQRFDPVSVKSRDFEQHLSWLCEHVEVLDGTGFARIMEGRHELARDAVLLTVDDAHRSFYEKAFPLLQHYGLPAILFVCPGLLASGSEPGEFMTWEELAKVQGAGVQIAPHGYSHRSLARCGEEEAEREIAQARAQLKQRLGADGPFFSLPFGTRRDFNAQLADKLLEYGYRYCFTSIHGPCRPLLRPNLLPRSKIEGGESLAMFRDIVSGGLDFWRVVDHLAWPLQQRGRL